MSMVEVAKIVGVSHVTVSRVINNQPGVSQATITKVRQAMRDIGYIPAPKSRRRGRRSTHKNATKFKIAVVMMDHELIHHSWLLEKLCAGVSAAAFEHGVATPICRLLKDTSTPEVLTSGELDGVLLVGGQVKSQIDQIKEIVDVPTIWVTSHSEGAADAVLPGNESIGTMACEYLHQQGHRKFAFISAGKDNPSYVMRGMSFTASAERLGINVDQYTTHIGDVDIAKNRLPVYESKIDRLVDDFIAQSSEATGIFCPSDLMTALLYRGFAKRGIPIGKKLKVVSCDNELPYTTGLYPRPATIDIGVEDRGRLAVEQLLWHVRNPDSKRRVQLTVQPTLVLPSP